MKLDPYVKTDVGQWRPLNEDAHLVRPESNLFAVADGMGGHAAGEVASRIAIDTLAGSAPPTTVPPDQLGEFLRTRLEQANDAIRAETRASPEHEGMGTTMTALAFTDRADQAAFAHIGDSRLYLWREGRLEQVTRDHTWVQEQIEQGALQPDQAKLHPLSSMLSRALGTNPTAEVDTGTCEVRAGDIFLICSDGLTNMVPNDAIEEILSGNTSAAALASALVAEANARGGTDNITALIVRAVQE
ncbi:MAG: Stp1/IreP family PP2C-type Ser/Thr phosphatase [Longimicrobiales bacterium]